MTAVPTDRKLKIAFVHQPWSVIQPPVNGADSVALLTDETARRLARSCTTITYCRLGKHQSRADEYDGVEYRRASVSIDRWIKLGMQHLDRLGVRNHLRPFFSSTLCYRQFIGQVIDDLARQDCDIVHVHNFSQFVPLIRAKLPKIKIVLQMHCEWLSQLDPKMIEERIARSDLVLGVSDFLAEKVRRRFPHLAERCRHVYNGADIARFARPNNPRPTTSNPRILYVGRLSPEKGIHTLLDAFKLVLSRHPNAHLELIGPEQVVPYEMIIPFCDDSKLLSIASYYRPGVYGQLLREKIAQLPAGSISFFNKGMEHTQLVPHYHAATVFASPSIWEEPFGMPLVEAMASSTPVVATRGGAFPEIVEDGVSGLLVDRGDPQKLADAIMELCGNDDRRRSMTDAGLARVSSMFTWERIAESLLEEYERIFSTAGARAAAT